MACAMWQNIPQALGADAEPEAKAKQYKLVVRAMRKFFEKYDISASGRMSTISSYLKMAFSHMWFVGFYVTAKDCKILEVGPYQGALIACGKIQWGKGVCGTAAAEKRTVVIDDVSKIENYIACDAETQSEIVVPVFNADGSVHSVLDIDSEVVAAFGDTDVQYLQEIVAEFVLPADPQEQGAAAGAPASVDA